MLLDRGLLEPGEAGYRVTGDLSSLQVPETLQTLIAARLDSLEADERALLQDASVLGRRSRAWPRGARRTATRPRCARFSTTSSARSSCTSTTIRSRRSAASTASCRRSSSASPTRRSRGGTARRSISPRAASRREAGSTRRDRRGRRRALPRRTPRGRERRRRSGDPRERPRLARAGGGPRDLARAADEAQRPTRAQPHSPTTRPTRTSDRARRRHGAHGEPHGRRRAALHARARPVHGGGRRTYRRTERGRARAAARFGRTEEAIRLAEEAYAVLGADELDRDTARLAAELARLHFFVGDLDTALARIEAALPSPSGRRTWRCSRLR